MAASVDPVLRSLAGSDSIVRGLRSLPDLWHAANLGAPNYVRRRAVTDMRDSRLGAPDGGYGRPDIAPK